MIVVRPLCLIQPDYNNENLQVKDNTNSSHNETQVPTHPIVATSPITSDPSMMSVPVGKNCATNLSERPNPVEYLTYFNCGHVTKLQNGTTLREFSLIASENNVIQITDNKTDPSSWYNAWAFNIYHFRPTMRMTQGDHVKIKSLYIGNRLSILTRYICIQFIQVWWMEQLVWR